MTTLRITDYSGRPIIIETNESADQFNERIDNAFLTGNYNIRLAGFIRMDVRNIALITEVKTDSPTQPEAPVEEPTVPEPAPEPEEPIEEEPTPEEPTEPIEESKPEPSEDN